MVQTNALELFVGVSAILQLAVAYLLARRGGWRVPFKGVSSLLLILNALVSFAIIARAWGAFGWLGPRAVLVERFFDLPTNVLLFFVAWALILPKGLAREGWPRPMWVGLIALGAASVLLGAVLFAKSIVPTPFELGFFIQQLPVYGAYALILSVVTVQSVRPNPSLEGWFGALILVAYGARPVQFGFQTGVTFGRDFPGPDHGWVTFPNAVSHVFLFVVSVACLLALAWRVAPGRSGADRSPLAWSLGAFVAFGVLGLVLWAEPESAIVVPMSLVTLVLVRPALLGWAFDREGLLKVVGLLGLWFAGAAFFKALVSQALGSSFWEITGWDLAVAALATGLLPVAAGAVRSLTAAFWDKPTETDGTVPGAPRKKTRAERVLRALVVAHETDPEAHVPSRELAQQAGVSERNLGRDIETLRQRLANSDPACDPRDMLEIRINHQGPQVREYRLTQKGVKAAVREIDARGRRTS